jgi:WD40 repeat protein
MRFGSSFQTEHAHFGRLPSAWSLTACEGFGFFVKYKQPSNTRIFRIIPMLHPRFRRPMIVISLIVIALMSFISLSTSAPSQASDKVTATPNTNESLASAQRRADEAMSLYWAASARLLDQNGDRASALALALEANRISNPPDQAVRALEDIAYAPGPRQRFTNAESYYGFEVATFSADGRKIVAARGFDSGLTVFDATTGEKVQELCCHLWKIIDVAFSPDGSKIISYAVAIGGDMGGPPELFMWDAASGKQLWPEWGTLLGDADAAHDNPTFSPDGTLIVANDGKGHLIARDVNTGKEIKRFSGKAADMLSGKFAFSADGNQIASGTRMGDVVVWDAKTTKQINRLKRPDYPISAVAFSPDGKRVLVANERGSLVLWNMTADEVSYFYSIDENKDAITRLYYNPDGQSVYSITSSGVLTQWDVETGEAFATIETHSSVLDMSPDRQHFLVRSPNHQIEVWDFRQGHEAQRYIGHHSGITSLAFSPNGEQFTSADQDGRLIVWNKDILTPIYRLTEHASKVIEMVYSPDGNMIASLGENRVIFLWDTINGKAVRQFNASANTVNFSPDGLSLLTAGSKDQLIQWDVSSGRETHRYTEKDTTHDWGSAVYSPDGRLILALDNRNAVLWDVGSGAVIRRFEVGRYAVFSPHGQMIIFEDQNHNMVFADTMTGQEIRHLDSSKFLTKTDFSEFYPYHVAFSSDGQRFLTSDSSQGLRVWDIQSGEVIRHFALTGDWAVFSPDGRFILTKTDDLGYPFISLYGRDVLLLRLDSAEELIAWTLSNRAVGTLSCDQRAYYRIEPNCNVKGMPTPR